MFLSFAKFATPPQVWADQPWAFALLHDDCLEEKVVGHIPIHLSKIYFRFLKLLFSSISAVVVGKRVNRGTGF